MKFDQDLLKFDLTKPLDAAKKGLLWWYVLVPIGVAVIFGVTFGDGVVGLSSSVGKFGNRFMLSVWGSLKEPVLGGVETMYDTQVREDNFSLQDDLDSDNELFEEGVE